MSIGKVLVADDDPPIRILLQKELSKQGYSVDVVENGTQALDKLREGTYNVALIDIVMPEMDGVNVLKQIAKEDINTNIIMLTGNSSIDMAVECMKLGAFEYIRKPFSRDDLLVHLERAFEFQRSKRSLKILENELEKTGYRQQLIGKSKPMVELKRMVVRVANTNSTVLILGESGTGKELVSRMIHDQSSNSSNPFVTVNCASLSETLLESELFGHEKGAFTDAKTRKLGLAEVADQGTLFLDEIGEVPLQFQAKLLRFLETGEIRRVGGTKDIKLNVRILCATNKPIEKLVQRNEFRADLYYRLNVVSINVPPLRERKDDIPLLVNHLLKENSSGKTFSEEAVESLKKYSWPGNVRELKNVVDRCCILSPGSVISPGDLKFLNLEEPAGADSGPQEQKEPVETSATSGVSDKEIIFDTMDYRMYEISNRESLLTAEKKHIANVLRSVEGNRGKAAEILGINPKTLYTKIRKYRISKKYK